MQSGITASQELHTAFKDLLNSSSSRGLLVGISGSPESLVPRDTVTSTSSDFSADLSNLQPLLKENETCYIILRQEVAESAGNCIAVTFVPEKAPVRQKMLFASTRLTLVRELGTDHFTQTLFATSPSELSSTGWSSYLASQSSTSPLTNEEAQLASIREAEAQESTGTSARRGGQVSNSVTLPIEDAAVRALSQVKDGSLGLVQLFIDIPTETLKLADTSPSSLSPSEVGAALANDAPRYSFYRYPETGDVLFIYTCPSGSKIKERMLYAASRASTVSVLAPEHGIDIKGKIEETDGTDVTEESILSQLGVKQDGGGAGAPGAAAGGRQGFARPKRPGRR